MMRRGRPWFAGPGLPSAPKLDIEVGADQLIFLRGELEANTHVLLEDVIDRLMNEGHRHLMLDPAELTFISASAMEMLVEVHRQLASMGGCLELRRPGERYARC